MSSAVSPSFIADFTLNDDEWKQQPIMVTDLTRLNDDGMSWRKRQSRFDVVGEEPSSSMYVLYTEDGEDPCAPPPPTLLPESMFSSGLSRPSVPPPPAPFPYPKVFPECFDWNSVYANFDPSSAAYRQFIDCYQQQQFNVPPPPLQTGQVG